MWSESIRVLNPIKAILESKNCEEKAKDNRETEKAGKKSLRDKIVDLLNKIEIQWVVK